MKSILEFILTTIVIFFVWNFLKRIFYNTFYCFHKSNNNKAKSQKVDIKRTKKEKKVNWDAETIDYEEIEDK